MMAITQDYAKVAIGMKCKMPFLETANDGAGVYGVVVAIHRFGTIDVEYNGRYYRMSGLAA